MSEDGRNEQSSTSVGRGGIDPMLNAKLTRRKVQQDVELMGNRIERLRAEERKAKQKVLETKLRGQEILQLQKRNQQAHAAKELSKRLEMEQHTRDQQSQLLRLLVPRVLFRSCCCVSALFFQNKSLGMHAHRGSKKATFRCGSLEVLEAAVYCSGCLEPCEASSQSALRSVWVDEPILALLIAHALLRTESTMLAICRASQRHIH